jgi:hypothetical protein
MREDARRIVIDDLDVGDEGRTGIEALEEVVRQQGILRHAPVERRRERVDVVEPLAGKDAFVEEILVDVRDRRRVRVHAGMAGVVRANSDPAALAMVTLTRGCRIP